ncbi:hypothetical protein QW131_28635 [Roseibium salinum]|nr:hypothetical protein [Roseibium salinum]
MRRILAVGTSVLLLSATASLGQERDIGELDDGRTGGQAQAQSGTNQQNQGDAIVERPVPPSMVDNSSWPAEIPFPAQDVSDDDLGPGNTPYPSGYPESAVHGVGEPGLNGAYQDSAQDTRSDNGASGMAEERQTRSQEGEDSREFSADQGPAAAWDGPEEGAPFHRGTLVPDRSKSADAIETQERQSDAAEARARRHAMDRDALGERRLRQARIALRSARYAVPEANFRTYNFEIEKWSAGH